MKFLFSHRSFPAQFKHIIAELAKNPDNEIVFLTSVDNSVEISGVKKIVYKLKRKVPKNCHRYLRLYEEAIIHGQAAAEAAIKLKLMGFTPDVIYSHSWGNSLFLKDVFQKTPQVCYCEWYYNAEGADIDFDGKKINEDMKALTRAKNAPLLIDLVNCDLGICPTNWQKAQFPKEFQDKLRVLHDGIDTNYFVPDSSVVFKIPNSEIELSAKDEVLTYATRGMEPYRGFPQFMEAVETLLQERPNLHVVIAGEDRVCYGAKLLKGSYKELMLNKLNLDMTRVHFTGHLPYEEYRKLLQISSVHAYFTYPFVLSWSLLEAMSCGCCVVASDTMPVKEMIKNNENGLLFDFYSKADFVKKVIFALNEKNKTTVIRQNARTFILDNYNLESILVKQIGLLKSVALDS